MQPKISSSSYAMFLLLLSNEKLSYKLFFLRDSHNPVEDHDHFAGDKKYLPLEIQIHNTQLWQWDLKVKVSSQQPSRPDIVLKNWVKSVICNHSRVSAVFLKENTESNLYQGTKLPW